MEIREGVPGSGGDEGAGLGVELEGDGCMDELGGLRVVADVGGFVGGTEVGVVVGVERLVDVSEEVGPGDEGGAGVPNGEVTPWCILTSECGEVN